MFWKLLEQEDKFMEIKENTISKKGEMEQRIGTSAKDLP